MQARWIDNIEVGETSQLLHFLQRAQPMVQTLSKAFFDQMQGGAATDRARSKSQDTNHDVLGPGHSGRYGRPLIHDGFTANP